MAQSRDSGGGYDFSPALKLLPSNNQFRFNQQGPSSLSTLANLFDTLTVECSGVLVQPQWKHFRHIQMVKNDRIRLSNGIWRSWHLQFQKRRVPQYCWFDIEPQLDHHKRQAAVVLEGKYWKREQSAVATEYRKWRIHYHKKNKTRPPDPYMTEVVHKAKIVFEELQGKPHPPQELSIGGIPHNMPNLFDPLFSLMDTSPSMDDPSWVVGLQQPKLDMLNPTLDDFLNRLEPMDVGPRCGSDTFYSAPPHTISQATPTFVTSSTTPPPTFHTSYTLPPQQHSMSPTSFLNMPPPNETDQATLNIAQLANFPMKTEPLLESRSTNQSTCMYPLETFSQDNSFSSINSNAMTSPGDIFSMQSTLQHKVDDMEGAFVVPPTQLTPSHPHAHTTSTQNVFQFPSYSQENQYDATKLSEDHMTSHMTSSQGHMTSSQGNMIQQSFARVSSAGNLSNVAASSPQTRPPLERVKSEPIKRLREQVQKLNEEIDQQKSFADRQYTELLQTVLQQLSSGKASEQQKQALQNVLADPGLVNILRDVLLTTPTPGRQEMGQQEVGGAGMSLSEVHRGTPDITSPQNVLSPTDAATDFHSRIQMSSGPITPLPPLTMSYPSLATPLTPSPYGNYSGGSDNEATWLKSSRKVHPEEKEVYREMRRQSHISAEQKRRGSIKQGFDHLQSLVVNLSSYPSGKVSKAVVLEKTIEHIHHSHMVKEERERRMRSLRKEVEELNAAITHCQEMLPASGVPVTRQRFEENRQRFREYLQRRMQQNYKFWIFGIILRQLFETYNSSVSTGSVDELCRTVLAWYNQYCALPALRPIVMTSLRELSQRTSILTDPSQVPRQLAQHAQTDLQLQRQEIEKSRTTRFSFS